MTVQEFYDWCKEKKLEDAEIQVSMKCLGHDSWAFPIAKWNIDYSKSKEPNKGEQMFVRLGG